MMNSQECRIFMQRVCSPMLHAACRFSEWDPKITTFPGLYVVGAAWARVLPSALARVLSWQVRHAEL